MLLGRRLDAMCCGWGTRLRAAMRSTVCDLCAEGRAAMDADNEIGPKGAASQAPALEKTVLVRRPKKGERLAGY